MNFKVVASKRFYRDLNRLEEDTKKRIFAAIETLGNEPFGIKRGLNIKKLKAEDNKYRIRVGHYRVIYRIDGDRVLLTTVAHRREAYR